MNRILIVGGVAGGATAAARLRRLDEYSKIIVFERGKYVSFANCGLPYYIGDTITNRDGLILQTGGSFLKRYNIDVRINNEVTKIDPLTKTVTVKDLICNKEYQETYTKLILAPGAEPIKPPIEGIYQSGIFTLRNIEDTDNIKEYISLKNPKDVAIIGGGFIGIEMAENLFNLGINVSIIEIANQILPPLDIDIVADIQPYLEQNGISLYLNNALRDIKEHEGRLLLELSDGSLKVDMVILAIGVKPENRLAKDAKLTLNSRGGIVVNSHMQTSNLDIYAVGDVVEVTDYVTGEATMIPLAGPANKQARIAADNICGIPSTYSGTQGSSILKVFDMTVASTGINEKTAKRIGLNYDKVFLWLHDHASYYPQAKYMSSKIIFDKENGRILGAQIVGFEGVDKRCDVLAVAIRMKLTAYDLTQLELCYAPPYSSAKDPVNIAGFVIENLLENRVKQFHWHDVCNLARDGSIEIVDVRTREEIRNGAIEGSVNIPIDELRSRIDELNKEKTIYVYCQSGMRSYIASRILMQNGFNAYSLSGGYRLYKVMQQNG